MIVSALMAAAVAAQQAPASQPEPRPAPSAEKKMACCEKMKSGEGCCCCKGMEKDNAPSMDHGNHGAAAVN